MQRIANPCTPVRFRYPPPQYIVNIIQKPLAKTTYSHQISVHNSYTKYRCRFDESSAIVLESPPESGPPTGIGYPSNWRISDGWKTREARRDCIEASAGLSSAGARSDDCRGGAPDRRDAADILSMAEAVWWDAKVAVGSSERAGEGEPTASAGGV